MIYPRAVSDGQFYSPPESIAGDVLLVSTDVFLFISLQYSLSVCVCVFLQLLFETHIDFVSKLVSAGSEEDLDEEGLGRRAVTAQVAASVWGTCTPCSALLHHMIMTDDYLLLPLFVPGEGVCQTGSRGHVCGGADPSPGGQLEVWEKQRERLI